MSDIPNSEWNFSPDVPGLPAYPEVPPSHTYNFDSGQTDAHEVELRHPIANDEHEFYIYFRINHQGYYKDKDKDKDKDKGKGKGKDMGRGKDNKKIINSKWLKLPISLKGRSFVSVEAVNRIKSHADKLCREGPYPFKPTEDPAPWTISVYHSDGELLLPFEEYLETIPRQARTEADVKDQFMKKWMRSGYIETGTQLRYLKVETRQVGKKSKDLLELLNRPKELRAVIQNVVEPEVMRKDLHQALFAYLPQQILSKDSWKKALEVKNWIVDAANNTRKDKIPLYDMMILFQYIWADKYTGQECLKNIIKTRQQSEKTQGVNRPDSDHDWDSLPADLGAALCCLLEEYQRYPMAGYVVGEEFDTEHPQTLERVHLRLFEGNILEAIYGDYPESDPRLDPEVAGLYDKLFSETFRNTSFGEMLGNPVPFDFPEGFKAPEGASKEPFNGRETVQRIRSVKRKTKLSQVENASDLPDSQS